MRVDFGLEVYGRTEVVIWKRMPTFPYLFIVNFEWHRIE